MQKNNLKNINIRGFIAIVLYSLVVCLSGYAAWLGREVAPSDANYLNPTRLEYKAENGDATSQYLLGMLYFSGHIVKEDQAKALLWFKRAAGNNHTDAQYQVCNLLEQSDPNTAFNMCYVAAQKMHKEASARLGVWYLKGTPHEPPNGLKGATFLSVAAEQGHVTAMYNLAQVYKTGAGVKEDLDRAYYWGSMAEALEQNADVKAMLSTTKSEWGSKLNKKTKDAIEQKVLEKLKK